MKKVLSVLLVVLFSFVSHVNANDKISPQDVKGANSVSASQAKNLFDKGALFIDVRSNNDWAAGRIPDAVHLELKKVFNEQAMSSEAAKDEDIVIYCNGESCLRSSKASKLAVSWGFSKIHYFRDGLPAWKKSGYPVE